MSQVRALQPGSGPTLFAFQTPVPCGSRAGPVGGLHAREAWRVPLPAARGSPSQWRRVSDNRSPGPFLFSLFFPSDLTRPDLWADVDISESLDLEHSLPSERSVSVGHLPAQVGGGGSCIWRVLASTLRHPTLLPPPFPRFSLPAPPPPHRPPGATATVLACPLPPPIPPSFLLPFLSVTGQ